MKCFWSLSKRYNGDPWDNCSSFTTLKENSFHQSTTFLSTYMKSFMTFFAVHFLETSGVQTAHNQLGKMLMYAFCPQDIGTYTRGLSLRCHKRAPNTCTKCSLVSENPRFKLYSMHILNTFLTFQACTNKHAILHRPLCTCEQCTYEPHSCRHKAHSLTAMHYYLHTNSHAALSWRQMPVGK